MKHFLHYRANRRQHLELGEVQAILTKPHSFLLRRWKFKSEKNCKSIIRVVCAEVRHQLTDTSSSSYLNNNENSSAFVIPIYFYLQVVCKLYCSLVVLKVWIIHGLALDYPI